MGERDRSTSAAGSIIVMKMLIDIRDVMTVINRGLAFVSVDFQSWITQLLVSALVFVTVIL